MKLKAAAAADVPARDRACASCLDASGYRRWYNLYEVSSFSVPGMLRGAVGLI